MYKDRYFEVSPGIKLRYIDEGQGRPIVFVPGWMFSADVFERQIDYFKKRYRCIAIDPRCHGKSTITREGNSYDQQGEDLGKLVEHLKLRDIVLAGWSFGAIACWAYAEQFGFLNIAASVTIDNSPRSISDDENEYRAGSLDNLRNDHHDSLCSRENYFKFMEGFVDSKLYEGVIDADYRRMLINTACRIPFDVADLMYVDGWLADKREIVKKLDKAIPSLLYIANDRKEAGVPFMKREYPNTEIHAFGMHMMFHEYADKFNEIMDKFIEHRTKMKYECKN